MISLPEKSDVEFRTFLYKKVVFRLTPTCNNKTIDLKFIPLSKVGFLMTN